MKKIMLLLSLLTLAGCASVVSVSLTPIPANRSNKVTAEAEKWSFLGITFDNDYVDEMSNDLKSRCPNGLVTGILTKDEVYAYLLVFKRKVTATGYCLSSNMPTVGNASDKNKIKRN